MIELNARTIADLSEGTLAEESWADITVTSAGTDSRTLKGDSLFLAKPGEFVDGADFVPAALANGARLVMAERQVSVEGTDVPTVVVPDVVAAMGKLASGILALLRENAAARGASLKVVGITGSAGKTTTKDLLAHLLSAQGPTVAPVGSYNGEVGVPLTVFETDESTEYLIIEMGATKIRQIDYLCSMVRPEVGVVLMVGSAHAGEFGGVENIAAAKGELVSALPANGTAVLNYADLRVKAMAERTEAHVLFFQAPASKAEPGQVNITEVSHTPEGYAHFVLTFPNGWSGQGTSGLLGDHHLANIAAAAGAAYALGVPAESILASLDHAGPRSRWRMERTERADGVTVINDAYNANPESMRAALRTLAELGSPQTTGVRRRTWAVLGEMLELGQEHVSAHDEIGRRAVKLNIDKLVVIGAGAKAIYSGAVMEGSWGDEALWVPDMESAYELLSRELQSGDIVLLKSSNGARVRELGDRLALEEMGARVGTTPDTDQNASREPSAEITDQGEAR